MTVTEKWRDRLPMIFCALALTAAAVGFWQVNSGQQQVIEVVTARPVSKATRTLWVDWICRDGENVHVEATSEVNEGRDVFFARFDADVAAREKDHPMR